MSEEERNFQEGVFSGVMGTYEHQGYEGDELREKLVGTLKHMMNWSDTQVEQALEEVAWMFSDNS